MTLGPNGLPQVKVIPRYLEHKSGSKFYEVIGFECMGLGFLVRRWGGINEFKKADAGPDIKIERTLAGASLQNEVDRAVNEKTRAAKGYSRITVQHGLHRAMSDNPYNLEADKLVVGVTNHYGDKRSTRVLAQLPDERGDVELNASDIYKRVSGDDDRRKQEEVKRPESWGAW